MTISVIDIGTSSVKTLIATIDNNVPNVVGFSVVPNTGLRKSSIVDIDATISAIKKSITDAELMGDIKVEGLKASIGGEHVLGIPSKGLVVIGSNSGITKNDVIRVIDQTRTSTNMDDTILHILPISFTVDEQEDIKNPIGLIGQQLRAQTLIITVSSITLTNFSNAIERAGYELDEFIVQHVAACQSVLDKEERDLGVALVDIGGGTTKISVFLNDALQYVDTINVGGENITQDLSIGLRTPRNQAEKIKIENGYCMKDMVDITREITIPGVHDREDRKIRVESVIDIIEPRVNEIMELIRESLEKSGYMRKLNTGIVLTGGTALLNGIQEIAHRQLELPVKIGYPEKLNGIQDHINSPEFSVAIGMILHTFSEQTYSNYSGNYSSNANSFIKKTMKSIKELFNL